MLVLARVSEDVSRVRETARSWLLEGLRGVAGDLVDEVLDGKPRKHRDRETPYDPYGEPGGVYDYLTIIWDRASTGVRGDPELDVERRSSLAVRGGSLTRRRVDRALAPSAPLPLSLDGTLCVLDADGRPPGGGDQPTTCTVCLWEGPTIAVEHYVSAATSDIRELALARLKALCSADGRALGYTALYGSQIDLPLEHHWPRGSLPQSVRFEMGADWLMGYTWVTVVPAHLAARIRPERVERARLDLHEVAELASGSLWLRATRDPGDYRDDVVRAMFLTLVDILPDVTPVHLPDGFDNPAMEWPFVYENAADYR